MTLRPFYVEDVPLMSSMAVALYMGGISILGRLGLSDEIVLRPDGHQTGFSTYFHGFRPRNRPTIW